MGPIEEDITVHPGQEDPLVVTQPGRGLGRGLSFGDSPSPGPPPFRRVAPKTGHRSLVETGFVRHSQSTCAPPSSSPDLRGGVRGGDGDGDGVLGSPCRGRTEIPTSRPVRGGRREGG